MRVLLVGGGGREHALAWKLRQDLPDLELLAAPGNPGIGALAERVPTAAEDISALVELARHRGVDLVVVGPEAPLSLGLVDALREHRIAAFGPSRAAARIETSKAFAKDLMLRAAVPTAEARVCSSLTAAREAIAGFRAPVVVKASGLAAGKGVVVAASMEEAEGAARAMLEDAVMGEAGSTILVEEFMEGEELSFFGLTDGFNVLPMLPAQDHKRLGEGDMGPNTGGMGAYAPVGLATDDVTERIVADIMLPTLGALRDERAPFTGLLYAGIMLTSSGPRVVEFNCRFGDPETQALLPLLRSSLLEPMLAVGRGDMLAGAAPLEWRDRSAVTTVVASAGYPASVRKGVAIKALPADTTDLITFQAGTELDRSGALVTAGGRVCSVTGLGATFEDARRRSAEGAAAVVFDGAVHRRDIGWRESARRHAGAA